MYRRPVLILILYFNLMCIQTQTVNNVPESEKKYFNRKSAFLHNLTIKILHFLDLDRKTIKLNRSQALLTMFKQQNHIAENLLSSCDGIKNITFSNVTRHLLNLRNILEDIIREEMHHSRKYYVDEAVNKFDREFAVFVNIFFDKALKLSMKNVMKITNQVIQTKILNTSWKRTRDIKVWKPSSIEHFDLFNNTRRIYKGKKAKIKDFPFLVSILINNEFASAGSIISKDLVITAATGLNVLYKSDKYQELIGSILVRVGSDYALKEGNLVSVIDVIFHPGYDPHSLQNNLAIVRLVRRLRFSNKRKIQRILYDKKGDLTKSSLVIVLGWGAKDANKDVNFKQKVSVSRLSLFDMDKCVNIYSGFYVKDSNFCAGFTDKGGGACNKDTGGPGIVDGELAGVISFGPTVCGQAASPTVFTKIANNIDWISSVIDWKRTLKLETTTKRPETMTEPHTFIPLTNTISAKPQQIPLKTSPQAHSLVSMQTSGRQTSPATPAPPQLVSELMSTTKQILRLPSKLKMKESLKLHRFVTANSVDLSNISLPFSKAYFQPTLFSKSPSLTTEMYPDQTIILKEILKEIILSNTSVIDYILYGDILEDNIEAKYLLSTTAAVDVMQHQLVNKSVFLIEHPEEIIHPVRAKAIKSKFVVENSHESNSYDEEDIPSRIKLLQSLLPQPDKPDTNKYKQDDNNLKEEKTVTKYITKHPDTVKSSKKKVTDQPLSTVLYDSIGDSNEITDDLSRKLQDEIKDNSDDYYDDESHVATANQYEKETKTKLTVTSTTKKHKRNKNVVYNSDDVDTGNQQDKMDRNREKIYSDKNVDDIKQSYDKKYSEEDQRSYEMGRKGVDRSVSGINVSVNKKQNTKYNFQDNQQDEMDQMERDLFADNFNKNLQVTPNEKVQTRDNASIDNDENKYKKKYLRDGTENKQGDREQKHSAGDYDNYGKDYQSKNNHRGSPDKSENKGERMNRFTPSTQNYYYDYDNIPQRTAENRFGKAAAIPTDEFDYNDRDLVQQNAKTYKNKNLKERFRVYGNRDYNKRAMSDEDEKVAQNDENYKKISTKRQKYKKSSSHDNYFLSIL